MSANNFLKLIQKSEIEFVLYECCADIVDDETTDPLEMYGCSEIDNYLTIEEAIQGANKYMSENIVEYGLDISLLTNL
jgi:hypothetical protein